MTAPPFGAYPLFLWAPPIALTTGTRAADECNKSVVSSIAVDRIRQPERRVAAAGGSMMVPTGTRRPSRTSTFGEREPKLSGEDDDLGRSRWRHDIPGSVDLRKRTLCRSGIAVPKYINLEAPSRSSYTCAGSPELIRGLSESGYRFARSRGG